MGAIRPAVSIKVFSNAAFGRPRIVVELQKLVRLLVFPSPFEIRRPARSLSKRAEGRQPQSLERS